MRRAVATAIVTALALVASGCGDGRHYEQAIAVLIDVSGTYEDQKADVARIVKRDVLPNLVPGDTLLVMRIDSQSYEKSNVEALVTLDYRPSRANAQKLAIARKLDAFASMATRSEYTDIPGAMMLASEYLREIPAGSRVMLVFSDLQEDLPKGAIRQLAETEFEGIQLVAMNVKRLQGDAADPAVFRTRVAGWERRTLASGAQGFVTLMDAAKLGAHLAEIR